MSIRSCQTSRRSRVLAACTVTAALLVVLAPPAWAVHVVQWGIENPDGSRETITTGQPVSYEVLVSLDGSLPWLPIIGGVVLALPVGAGLLVSSRRRSATGEPDVH